MTKSSSPFPDTTDEVWRWMLDYQHCTDGIPPTLEEIRQAHPRLNYRSSVRKTIQRLIADGRVEPIGRPGISRRYRAIESPTGGTDVDDLIGMAISVTRLEEIE